MKQLLYAFALLTLTLSSCQLGKHYTRPELNLPNQLEPSQEVTDSASIADMKWWDIYVDTTLQALIAKTVENNKDMKIAAARVKELAALRRIDFANLFPQINGSTYTQKESLNYGGDNYKNDPETGAKLTVSWELDLWGNLRWAKDRSMAQFLASIESQRALQMSIVSDVARSYFELVALDNELAIVKQTLNARQEGVRLANLRYQGGLTSETAYQQAKVEYARTATLVPDLERKIALKENDISFLAGDYPSAITRGSLGSDAELPETLPIGLPSTLLERRPDVRESEQKLIAANATVGVAYTNLFPRLSLTAQYGLESEAFTEILKSPIHFISANLMAPIFAMGKNRANLNAKKAAYEQACYSYEKAVLNAFRDAHSALVEFNKIKEIYRARLHLEQSSKAAMEFAQLQYINGVTGYLDLLDAQRSYFDAQIGLSNAIRDKQISLARLYKALGGGW
ncbi:MAG: efflux transporter outer membrane subunit [Phocaeicola sp.]